MKWWGGYQDLVAVHVDGGPAAVLFSGLAGKHLVASPDGRRIAADAPNFQQPGQGTIFIYAPGAAPAPVLTMTQADFSQRGCHIHPTWSRDGKRIYFNSMESGLRGFYAVDVN
jgi:Tol biopolymer transport system component